MIGALLVLTMKGEVLLNRVYRDDVPRKAAQAFRAHVLGAKEIRSPLRTIGEHTYLHVRPGNVYMVAVTARNINAGMCFEFMHRFIEVLKSYFTVVNENSIRENIFLIYELMDELMDFGYPQVTAADVLKLTVTQKGTVTEEARAQQQLESSFTIQATGAVQHRRLGIKYKRNEVFLDVIESVNLLVSANNNVLRSEVSGEVRMKSYLSGMPECKFGLNDKLVMDKEQSVGRSRRPAGIEIDDVKFHQCVKLGKFDSDRTISFVPPDGEFELMRYRCQDRINLPFKVFPNVKEMGRNKIEAKINVKAVFSSRLFANNVVVKMPCPDNTADAIVTVGIGKAKYDAQEKGVVWKIPRFQGETEFNMACEINLIARTSEKTGWSRPPIEMQFQVPMFTASGLKVRFLKVFEKSNYQTTKWVRYVTKAGAYQNRI